MKRITIFLAAAALVLSVSVPQVLASGGEGTRIVLKSAKAFPAAKGSAKFKATAEERELQVEVEPLVQEPPTPFELRAQRLELALHPAGRDRGHDSAAREEVQARELLQRHGRAPGGDDQRRDTELEPCRAAGEETHRDERLGDRAVHRRVLLGDEQVVGRPA